MTRARIVIAVAIAAAIAILVWLLAPHDNGPPALAPAATPDASASPASPDTRPDLPAATILPRPAPEGESEVAGPESAAATDATPPPRISVLVVDEAGAPQAAIPLSMVENGAHPVTSRATTGDDGTAVLTLAPLERLKGAGKDVADRELEVQIAIALPLDQPVEVSFDRGKVPESPIRLVLPQTGRVIVKLVTADGAPFTRDAEVELQSSDDGSSFLVTERPVVRAAVIAGAPRSPASARARASKSRRHRLIPLFAESKALSTDRARGRRRASPWYAEGSRRGSTGAWSGATRDRCRARVS